MEVDSTEEQTEDHSDHEHAEEAESSENLTIDQRIDQALANIEKGMAENNPALMMQQGVFKLREIEQEDSTNERALYHLGKLSMQSGQFEKAEVRFKKLILLHPSNEEYKELYEESRRSQGKN